MTKKLFISVIIITSIWIIYSCDTTKNNNEIDQEKENLERSITIKTSITSPLYNFDNEKAELKISSVTFNFFPENGKVLSDPRKNGEQFVRIELSITNTGDKEFDAELCSFWLKTKSKAKENTTYSINESNVNDQLNTKKLAIGETIYGAKYYKINANETIETIAFCYKNTNQNLTKEEVIVQLK